MSGISNLCRVCLGIANPKISLSSEFDERHTVRNCFRDFLGFSMSEDPRLPQQICVECFDRVLDARKLHMQCQDAENSLKLRLGIHKSAAELNPTPQDRTNTPNLEEVSIEKIIEDNEDLFKDLDGLESVVCDSNQDMEYEMLTHMVEEGTEENEENLENLEPHGHQNKAAEEPSFQCTRCNEQFKHKRNLQLHDLYAHDIDLADRSIKMFQCEECSVSFDYERNYKIHMKRHHDRVHQCIECNKKFQYLDSLQRHFRSAHIDKVNESCLCPECGMSFENKHLLDDHYKAVHQPEHKRTNKRKSDEARNVPVSCTVCDKVVKRKSFKTHMRTHTGEKPYECQYCMRRFVQIGSWKTHLAVHEGFTIPCDYPGCTKMFARIAFMRKHVRVVHHGERPYACDMPGCEKSFKDSSMLRKHREDTHTHADGEPVKCGFCGKSYAKPRFLQDHIKAVHKRKPYQCPYCEKAFMEPKLLMKHSGCKHEYAMTRQEALTHRVPENEVKNNAEKAKYVSQGVEYTIEVNADQLDNGTTGEIPFV